MRDLLDTNIFLEVLLGQEKSQEVRRLLSNGGYEFLVTDFLFHSSGVLLFRKNQLDTFNEFTTSLVEGLGGEISSISVSESGDICSNAKEFNPDFDDAYQYSVADKHGLQLVNFDHDFDRTDCRQKTPAEMVNQQS